MGEVIMRYLTSCFRFILITSCLILTLSGCKKTTSQLDLDAPQNLRISLVQNGAGIRLDWDAVSKANAYYVYFGDTPNSDSLNAIYKIVNQTYFIHESDALDKSGTGYYAVLAVGGEYDSVIGPKSNVVRTAPYEVKNITIYERNYSSGDSSAFGWDDTHAGRIVSINDTINQWHIYCDDGDSGNIIDTLLKFVTPQDSVGSNPPPDVPWDSTAIVFSSDPYAPLQITGKVAPTTGGIKEENVFYLLIDKEYYAKIFVQSVSTQYIKLDAYFQPLKGFRRF